MLLYVHVPFCARRCSYCDFAIAVRRSVPSDAFAEDVVAEWQLRLADPWWELSPTVETVYFGGGTPSHVAPSALERILDAVAAERTIAERAEITIEANPDDISEENAREWRASGINRVSLGVQSFDPAVLDWMHRTHTAQQVPRAFEILRAAGFDNISLDLIYGLPASLDRDWGADLDQALALEPEHLSLYALTIEPGTPLGKWSTRGAVLPLTDDRVATEYLAANRRLVESGFEHYEVSNAARPGFRAVHNAGYWRRVPFLGLGPSAHSGAGNERRWNLREYVAWREGLGAGRDPLEGRESLDEDQVLLERRYLGLRTDTGVEMELIPEDKRRSWVTEGWAVESPLTLRLTPEGWLRLDALVASL
ncbi:MAG TPA: radical SAM family heme chaperone HemW [Gemmatimonadales bacterium]|nr:radical SAM family heme chaperone HemW [Gemmatimonadales bacterium]